MGKGAKGSTTVNEYRMSIQYGWGVVCDALTQLFIGERLAWSGSVTANEVIEINQPDLFGGVRKEGGAVGSVFVMFGRDDQVMPEALASRYGLTSEHCPAHRGVTTTYFVGSAQQFGFGETDYLNVNSGGFYWAANSPFIQAVWATLRRKPKTDLNQTFTMIGNDANGAHIIYEALTNTEWGMGAPAIQFNTGAFNAAAEILFNESFGLSLIWTRATKIENFIGEVLNHIQATVYVNPRTGLFDIKLLRDDYTFGDLALIDEHNATFTSFQRKMWGETTNEMVVTWTNPVNEQEETVVAHNAAAHANTGAPISDSRSYYAIRNAELAMRLAYRDLRSASAPLAQVEVEVDRTQFDVLPGSIFRVSSTRYDLDQLVCRVLDVSYGKKSDAPIKLKLLEDVFSLTRPTSAGTPASAWSGVSEAPAAMAHAQVLTLPYFLARREIARGVEDLIYPEVFGAVLAYQPGGDTIAYDLYGELPTSTGAVTWQSLGTKTIVGRAELLTPFYVEAVTAVNGLPNLAQNRGPQLGSLVVIGAGDDTGMEIALLSAYTPGEGGSAGTWTLNRGVLDTVPKEWAIGTPVWFLPLSAVIADTTDVRSVAEEVEYQLLTRTSQGMLTPDTSADVTGTMTARPHMPLRPANVKINTVGFGEVDATGATGLACTWSNRNRLTEDTQVTNWTAGNVAGEQGQETLISVYRPNGTLMFQVRGLYAETTYTIPLTYVEQETRIFVRFSSERGGLGSIQSYGLWVKNLPVVVTPAAPPSSPVVVGSEPSPPGPDPDPTPDPLPSPSTTPSSPPGGNPVTGEWSNNDLV